MAQLNSTQILSPAPAPVPALQFLFIDAAVADADSILAHVDPAIQVVRLNAGEEGLTQMVRALAGRTEVRAIHIVSHGAPGSLLLGNGSLDIESLAAGGSALATIRDALSADADLLLYGCDVAGDDKGMAFLAALADATGADVAASADTTGAAFSGGDWQLEAQVGAVQTLAIGALDYSGTLGADSQLPAGLQGNGPTWTWGGQTFQIRQHGEITTSDPLNPLRSGSHWDRYALDGIPAGSTVRVYMGNSSTVDDYLQIERNGSVFVQNDDSGDGERSYDAYVSWTYQPGDVIRATTYASGNTGTYTLWISSSAGTATVGDIGNAPAPAPPPPTAPTFTGGTGMLTTYTDTGASNTFNAAGGTLTGTDTTPNGGMSFSVQGSNVGTYGTLSVASNGSYSYAPSAAAINALATGVNASDSFTVRITEGGGLFSTGTISVNVVGANDAPLLASDAAMPAILEDASADAPGVTIASVFGPRFVDVDNGSSLGGVVIVGNSADADTEGRWQYSTDGGNAWHDVGNVSAGSGLALSASTRLHFVPVADYHGTPGGLTVHAADDQYAGGYGNGASRISFDTTSDALSSGVSVGSRALDIAVAAVNDAPTFTSAAGAATIADTSAWNGSFSAASGALTGTLTATDVDHATHSLSYSIRGGSLAEGEWTLTGRYGTLTLDATTHAWTYAPGNLSAINALAQGEVAHDVFEFRVADPAGGYSTQQLDITLNGSNDVPLLAASLSDQGFSGGGTWQYQIPAASFTDAEGLGLSYTVEVLDGEGTVIDTIGATHGGNPALASSWLSFDEGTRTFSGNPSVSWGDALVTLRVTATDPSGASVSDIFALTLSGTANQAPVVSSPLALQVVAGSTELTSVSFDSSLGGTTIAFDGSGPIVLGSAASAATVASAVLQAFQGGSTNYTATAQGADTVRLTAKVTGALPDLTSPAIVGSFATLGGGTASVTVVTQGAAAVAERQRIQFEAWDASYGTVEFDGMAIPAWLAETTEEMVSLVAAAINDSEPPSNWTASAATGYGADYLVLTARVPGTNAGPLGSFSVTYAGGLPGLTGTAVTLADGAPAVREVVDVQFSGALGGSTVVIDGISATAGAPVSGAAIASALANASGTTAHYQLGELNGNLLVTALLPGASADLTAGSFTGSFTGTPSIAVLTQGSGWWTYQIPGGTFTDAENDTLTYAAYAIDDQGNATPIGNTGGALSFDPATRTLSGDGTALGANVVEIRATDAGGSDSTAVTRLPLFLDDGTHQTVSTGADIGSLSFGAGPGTHSAQIPANAFVYADLGGSLSYSATLANGDPLPSWLAFNASTGTFSGNPPDGASSPSVIVRATDSDDHFADTQPFTLSFGNPNDALVLVAPIADQALVSGNAFNLTVSAPFSNPDGTAAGGATTEGISYSATANGQPLADFGLTLVVNDNGAISFSGNPPGGTPYLNIVVTGTEEAGETTATTSFTLNLNDPEAGDGALSANNIGTVAITGTATQGQTLTAAAPVDADGYTGGVNYQWQVNTGSGWVDVAGSRGQASTLTLTQAEVGQVRVQAFYTDHGGVPEAPVSSAVTVANVNDAGAVSISGSPSIGQTISAALSDADGLADATPTYQWYRGNSAGTATEAIGGATYSSYTVTNGDGGKFLRVVVSYTDDHDTAEAPSATTSFAISLGDVAPVAADDTGSALEAGGIANATAGTTSTGNVLGNDTDANNNISLSAPIASVRSGGTEGLGNPASEEEGFFTVAGLYGTLVLNHSTGAYTYTINDADESVQALNSGDTLVDRFNYTVQDATLLNDTGVLAITINGANDRPSMADLPVSASFTEDIAAQLRLESLLVDPDLGSSFTLRMQVSAGALTANGNDDVIVTGSDTGTLTVTGTMQAVQLWLGDGGINYTSPPNDNTPATLSYYVDDGGGEVLAGTTTMLIAEANDAPVLDLNGSEVDGNNFSTTFRPRGNEVAVVDSDVRITDIDDTLVTGATVTLAAGAADNNFGTLYETLRSSAGSSFQTEGGTITISGNGSTTLVVSGIGTHAEYEALLRTVLYNNSNPNAYAGDRTVTITLTDAASTGSNGALASNTASFTTAAANNAIAVGQHIFLGGIDTGHTVAQVLDSRHFVASGPLEGLAPDAQLSFHSGGIQVTTAVQSGPVVATTTVQVPWTPVVDMNGEGGSGRHHAVTYTEGGVDVAVATSDASITDQDGHIARLVVTLTNPQDGGSERLTISSTLVTQLGLLGITVEDNNSHAITLSGNRDSTFYQVGLRAVRYLNESQNPSQVDRIVSVSTLDVDGNSGVGAQTTITLHAVNDAPNGIDGAITTAEDTAHVFAASEFGFADPLDGAHALAAVRISSLPAQGVLSLGGVAVTAGQTIPLADLNAGRLTYLPGADRAGSADASFTFQVQDDGGTAYGGVNLDPTPATMTIHVTPVNDAPVLAAGGADFNPITEQDTSNNGQRVSDLLATIGDVDAGAHAANNGNLTGMAVHGTAVGSGGTWQYNLNDAGGWHSIGSVNDGAALLLRSTDRVRFVPDTLTGTTASFSYYAWDQSVGTAGTTVDVSTRGGSTPYSLASDDAGITVTDVNDAPSINAPGTQTVAEDGSTQITGLSFADIDIGVDSSAEISVTLSVGHGTLTLAGTSGIVVEAGADGSANLTIRGTAAAVNTAVAALGYAPQADYQGGDTLAVSVNDRGNIGSGGPLGASTSIAINVTPTNDAPVLTAAAPLLAGGDEDLTNPAGQTVASFVAAGSGTTGIDDVDTGGSSAVNGTGQGIAIHAAHNLGPATGGTWQFSINGGNSWSDFGSVSDAQALLLRSSDLVRFVPDGQNATVATFDYYAWDGASGTPGTHADAGTRGGTTAFSIAGDTASITITPVNDAPTIDLDANNSSGATGNDFISIFSVRGGPVAVVDADISIGDPDRLSDGSTDTLVSATLTITAGDLDNLFGTTYESLSSSLEGSYSGSLGAISFSGNGTLADPLVLSGAGTWADYQAALRTVVYNNANPNAFAGDRTVRISVQDAAGTNGGSGALQSAVVTTTIRAVWAPVADLDGSGTPGRSYETSFTEGMSGVAIAASNASIVDQDGNIAEVVVTITNRGPAEKLFIDPAFVTQLGTAGISVTGNHTGAITLSGNRDGTTFQLGLRAIQYVNTSDNPTDITRTISVALTDREGHVGVGANTVINLVGVNDAPVGVDSAVTLLEDQGHVFAVGDFGFTDTEGHALHSVRITTLPNAGSLTLDGSAVSAGQWISAADIAAGRLVFTPAANANNLQNPNGAGAGYAGLTFQVRDAGGTEGGGDDVDATPNTMTINVTPVNDLPTGGVGLAGALQVGQVLSIADAIGDVDGPADKSYQWQTRSLPSGEWTDIIGATQASYTLQPAQQNLEVRVVVSYADTQSSSVPFASDVSGQPALVADEEGNLSITVDGEGPILIAHPLGDVTIINNGTAPVTVSGLPPGANVSTGGTGPVGVASPHGDVRVDNGGTGTVTVTGLLGTATLTTVGTGPTTAEAPTSGATVVNNGVGTVTVTGITGTLNTDGSGPGDIVVNAAADGAVINHSGSDLLTVNGPLGNLAVNNLGEGAVTVHDAADGSTVSTSGAVTLADPLGSFTLQHSDGAVVTVTGMDPGATLTLQGNGPVVIDTQLSSGEHIRIDTSAGGNLHISNSGDGTVDVVGGLNLGEGSTVTLALHGAGAQPIIAAGGVVLDDTPLVLDLGYDAVLGDRITLLSNTDDSPIAGTFAGLPEGGTLYLEGHLFSISYQGGDGNDIVLSRVNDAARGSVTLSGTAAQGEVLSASHELSDTDGLGAITYAWMRGDTLVGTGSSYTLEQDDVGASLRVQARYTDAQGTVERVESAATAAVENVNDLPTGRVNIVGTPTQGRTLTASHTLVDLDGLGAITYLWVSGDTVLGNGSSYTLSQADVGRSIQLMASYTDGFGTVETVASEATSPVANVNDAPTGGVSISGIADVGQTLTVSNSLADADGPGPVAYSWMRGSTVVGSGSHYTLSQDDVGQSIHVAASYTDGQGSLERVNSPGTTRVNAVDSVMEAGAPSYGSQGVLGDANGDGIADVDQADVVSMWIQPGGGSAPSSFVTLVADSNQGQTTPGSGALITAILQSDTFVAPPMAQAPLGQIGFTATAPTAGVTETFSLYVDASVGANGFWVHDASGTLVNLASEAFGGQVVQEGDRTRLDFRVADGSQFDIDAAANGSIDLAGLAGYMPLSLLGYNPDLPTHGPGHTPIWG